MSFPRLVPYCIGMTIIFFGRTVFNFLVDVLVYLYGYCRYSESLWIRGEQPNGVGGCEFLPTYRVSVSALTRLRTFVIGECLTMNLPLVILVIWDASQYSFAGRHFSKTGEGRLVRLRTLQVL